MAGARQRMTTSVRTIERHPLSAEDLSVGLRVLADLLDAGLPVSRALQAFDDLAPDGWRPGLQSIRVAVREGRGLAAGFAEAPVEIPSLVIGITRAGEAGSGLPAAVRRAAEQAESAAATRSAITSALAYPAVVAATGTIAVSIMVAVVLPKFAGILADLQQELPPTTRFVIGMANGARRLAYPLLAATILGSLLARRSLATENGRRAWDRALLATPGLGAIRRAAASARFTSSLSALLDSGVTVRSGLRHAAQSVGDREIAWRAEAARERISSGEPVARVLGELHVITPTAARLVGAGEETGRLAGMLQYASRLDQAHAERLTKSAVRLIEPLLIVGFAVIVGGVAAAILQAVYAVRPT